MVRHQDGRKRRETIKTYLAHELRDHPVEDGALVAKAVLSCAERPEVLYKKRCERCDSSSDHVGFIKYYENMELG